MWFYAVEIDDVLKRKIFLGEVKFKYDDVPSDLSRKTEEYVDKMDCILETDDKECEYFVERTMERWNKKAK